ncbi:hypothetical protein BV22DRAFT_1000766 [Leucogyrophana mollusca]|uniref:Uncharacterized protein n=1 Tax=Leucogyrophana mollusca TaxID=85980 RepID=A0ACB8BZE0_9AGAM|nr:hypothetical protein BV22DRAFT_1000766 [Leucogyrophana mollusca]
MAPSRASASTTSNISTVYSLSLLSEYTHSLDSLPIDLSRNFADLRELDAVLSSSMTSITSKIQRLTEIIEQGTVSKQERLFLLTDIAEEAARLKLGGEDKIRVACQAADNLKGHTTHMRTLLSLFPSFDMTTLNRNTTYPHVAPRSFMPLPEPSRRRRNYTSLLQGVNQDFSPAKRKRVNREDDLDVGGGKSPRKEKTGDVAAQRSRNGARRNRTDRAASPTESVLSVISRDPLPAQNHTSSSRAGAASNRAGNGTNKRSNRASAGQSASNAYENDLPTNGAQIFPPLSSSASHPSLPPSYRVSNGGLHSYELHGASANPPTEWTPGPLTGPGVPVERNPRSSLPGIGPVITQNLPPILANEAQTLGSAVDTATEAGEGDGEGDDKTYCFCDGISYGEMIACDDNTCEKEWFHLACIGLTVPPDGTWYCETCKTKQKNAKRSRGGKKRSGGGARSGGKAANS